MLVGVVWVLADCRPLIVGRGVDDILICMCWSKRERESTFVMAVMTLCGLVRVECMTGEHK